jgi:alpha-1,3-rhamnosyl/mannosyltransferase
VKAQVVFNARSVYERMTGMGHFALYVLELLEELRWEWLMTVLVSPGYERYWTPCEGMAVVLVNSADPLWEQLQLPALLGRLGANAYLTPVFEVPRVKVCRTGATVHDLIPLSNPEMTSTFFANYFGRHVQAAMELADLLVTVSAFSAGEIRRFFPAAADRLRVFPQGVTRRFEQVLTQDPEPVLQRYRLRRPFLFCPGPLEERKGIGVLLRAFSAFKTEHPCPLSLVMAGDGGGGTVDVVKLVRELGIGEWVRTPGYLAQDDFAALLSTATALVFPSRAEGFGRPVLEAFAAGVPVIASDLPPLREVGGQGCLYAPPGDDGALKEHLSRLVLDGREAKRLVGKGRQQLELFSHGRSLHVLRSLLRELCDTEQP